MLLYSLFSLSFLHSPFLLPPASPFSAFPLPPLLPSLLPSSSLPPPSTSLTQRAEKQRQFEAVIMAGVSEERKEAIWQSAQQKAVRGETPSN